MNTEPRSFDEYVERWNDNHRMESKFIGGEILVWVELPCPFCAAPDFMQYALADVLSAFPIGATCQECNRTAKFLAAEPNEQMPNVPQLPVFRLMLAGGPDQPAWMEPKIERLS